MYNINDKKTQSVAEAVKKVIENKKDFKPHMMYDPKTGKGYEAKTHEDHLKMKDMGYTHEKPSKKNETEVQDSDKDFVDTHTVDAEEDPEQKRQVEETEVEDEDEDDVEEGNAFGQAVTDAKKAGKKKFKFQGKEYKVESVDLEEGLFGDIKKAFNTGKVEALYKGHEDAFVKMIEPHVKSMQAEVILKALKQGIKPERQLRLLDKEIKAAIAANGGFKNAIKKLGIKESVDLEEATMSQGVKTAQTQIYSLEKSLKVGSNLNKGVNKSLEGKYDADFKKMQKAIGQIINVWEEIERDFSVNESAELEEAVDNFFGFPTKDKLVKFQSMAKKLKIKSISNPTVLKRGGKEFHVMGFEGSVSDIEKAMRVADGIIKESAELEEMFNRLKPDDVRDAYGTIELKYRSSADIRDAEDKLKKAGINVRKNRDTLEVDSDSPAFKKAKITSSFDSSKREKAIMKVLGESVEEGFYCESMSAKDKKRLNNIYKEMDKNEKQSQAAIKKGDAKTVDKLGKEYHKLRMQVVNFYNEDVELEEALKPADFVKGGDAKVTKREVDGMISKLFIDSKLAKAVEANAAYQDGYKGKVKNNPFDIDTADFHLFILGQQSAAAE